MPLLLQPAETGDLPAVAALMNTAFRGVGPGASWNTEAGMIDGDRTTEVALREELAEHPEAFLLLWRDGSGAALKGCVWLEPVSAERWYLGALTIDPSRQKEGLGRQLLAAAEAWARARGAGTMRMKVVHLRRTLIAWYERRGYRLTGDVEPFPYGDTRFGVPQRADLTFVVLEKSLQAAPQQ